jgi:polysaccharide biosynthesis protein PslJ
LRVGLDSARRLPPAGILLCIAVGVMALDEVHGSGGGKYPPVIVIGLMLGMVAVRSAKRWSWLIGCMLVVILLIPADGRYTLAANLPIQMEPYRVVLAILLVGWLVALLVDPRVRARASKLELPLMLIVIATLGSEAVNPARVGHTSSYVIKAIWLFASMVFGFYLIVSVVRSRAVVERLLSLLVTCGCIEAVGAMYQRRSGTDIFDRLHFLLPGFQFNGGAVGDALLRGGAVRATASAGHPIELSSSMAMLLPIAAYLAISRGQKRWWLAVVLLLGGDFAGGSRTGVIGLALILIVFIWLRPRQTLRCWPALFPALIVVHFVSPGALGGLQAAFFPKGGLINQQTQTYIGRGGVTEQATRLSRLGPSLHEFWSHNPLFGEGYGTRVTGNLPSGQPNPDDNAQVLDDEWLTTFLETGILGIVGWILLFGRVIRRLGARAKLERGVPEGWLPVALAASVAAFASSMFTYDAFSFTQATFLAFVLMALSAVVLLLPPTPGSLDDPAPVDPSRIRDRSRTRADWPARLPAGHPGLALVRAQSDRMA